jgi:signal transduction histidine kinase/ligand-binding sensor domain-containing protein
MSNPRTRQLTRHSPLVYPEPFGQRATPKFFFLACAVLLCVHTALALDPSLDISQYAHTAWKVRDGFTRGGIFAIAQTPDGYLWLGTESGLYRFDGVRAVPWQPQAGHELPSNFINNLLVARDGTLWIGTLKGLASFKDGKVSRYPELTGPAIEALIRDREDTVWIGAFGISGGDNLCAAKDGSIHCYGTGALGRGVGALYEDHKGNLWVAAETGLWRWTPGTPEHYPYPFPGGMGDVDSLLEDDSGIILLGTDNGLQRLAGRKIESYVPPDIKLQLRPTRMLHSSDGSLWFGTWQGLVHVHQGKTDVFRAADGLTADFVTRIFQDREGNVWVGTQDGLDRFRDVAAPTISRNEGLANTGAWSVQAAPDGSIWIGTADGLNRWANGRITVYRSQRPLGQIHEGRGTNVNANEIANSGLSGTPQALGHDQRGRLWASTSEGVFYLEHERFIRIPGVPGGFTEFIVADGQGNVWLSNEGGLYRVSPELTAQRIPWSQFGHGYAHALLPDPLQDGLWLGFADGGIAYFKDAKVHASYSAADGLGKGLVSGLRFGSRGTLWAATEGGLSRIKDGRITTLNGKNGLPCDAVHWSVEDDDHSVWLYMPCGLVRVARSELDAWVTDPKHTVKTTTFDSSDGVRSPGMAGGYQPAVAKSRDGRIWFLPRDGVSFIDPRRLPYNKIAPPVHIEQITADRKTYWQNFYGDASYSQPKLPPLVRDLTIDYTALSLVVPEKVHFRYKLEGWDRDWQDAGTRRQAFYTNLSPRMYRFRVVACNNSGVWNEEGAALDFVIPPAWYQTNWFRVLCVAAFLVLLWALYQLRLRQLAQQFNMRLEERVGERTRIARDLHDTLLQSFHGVLLFLQSGIHLMPEHPSEGMKTLKTAAEQAERAIIEGREAVQGLRASTVERNDLAMAIKTLGGELAAVDSNAQRPEFNVQVEGIPRELHPILRDEVYRIAGEAMRNAFHHADAKQIEVEIRYDERQLRVRVRDDGKGIDPKLLSDDGREGHFGLRGMRERAKLIGGKLTVWSELDSGTEVELSIPASRAYTTADGQRSWLAEKFAKLSGKDTELKS